jgi:hypothetical protein
MSTHLDTFTRPAQMAGALGPEVLADVRALRAAAAAAAEVPLPRTRAGRLKASVRPAGTRSLVCRWGLRWCGLHADTAWQQSHCCVCCNCMRHTHTVQARAAVEAHIAEHGTLGLPHEAVRLAFDLPPSSSLLDTPDRLQALKHATPSYSEAQVCCICMTGWHVCVSLVALPRALGQDSCR